MPAELVSLRATVRWSLSDVVVDAAYAIADQVQAANKHGVSGDQARRCWQSAQQALTVADRYLRELVNGVPSVGLDDPWAAEEPPF